MHVSIDQTPRRALPLAAYERDAVQRRAAQINVALGHPRLTAHQRTILTRELAELETKLAEASAEGLQTWQR
jgi:hypothetical protein